MNSNGNGHGKSLHNKVSFAGLLITLGIVFGDIGTSPLYVIKAIGANLHEISRETIYGSVSLIFWTLTLQTTLKYVIITLRANNRGEGGIFALYALIRRKAPWAYFIALIGGSTLLADGVITPAITVTSAIEGLEILHSDIPVVTVVVAILSTLFFVQQFGTRFLGQSFGPIMLIWFTVIGALGFNQVITHPEVFSAVNPMYAVRLLVDHPEGFFLLGAVFLATTGAEALYSDLGHCGLRNIRISWSFVKITLLLNYFGQAVWVINHPDFVQQGINPFYAIMPSWFLLPGIILATGAAIIASQALISGSYTLVSEAISLNFWPKMKIKYPTEVKGQMFVPVINYFLWAASAFVVIYFKESSNMEAAYGLSISITMLMTTGLLLIYLRKKVNFAIRLLMALVFFIIELSFLLANAAKFAHGGWLTLLIAGGLGIIMYVWYNGRKIKNSLMTFCSVDPILDTLVNLQSDESVPKFATNLAYITKSNFKREIESTIIHSLLHKQPKRADVYWLLHIDIKDEPYTMDYEVTHLVPGKVIKVDFYLGFRIEPHINYYFKQIIKDLSESGEVDNLSRHPMLRSRNIPADTRYILIDRILTSDQQFNFHDRLIMNISDIVKVLAITEDKSLKIDASQVLVEKVPLGTPNKRFGSLKRLHYPV